jgi:signal transduction histidine kinase
MIITAFNRNIKLGRRQLLFLLGVIGSGLMMTVSGFGFVEVVVLLALTWLLLRFATRPLSRMVARLNFSIRQKFAVAIAVIAVISLVAGLISDGAMDNMHQGLHQVQLLMGSVPTSEGYPGAISYLETPPEVRNAIDSLEDSQHGLFFSLIPVLSVLGVLVGAALGAAIAWSVVTPVQRMGEAMRKIASGEFTQPVQIENRDELGELGSLINDTSKQLAKLQEATLAAERARGLRERIAQVTRAQEVERHRISRELHDGLGPSLAAIGNRLRACQYVVRTDPQQADRQLEEIAKSLKVHVQEVRALIYDLRPLALDQLGLVGALKQHMDRFSQESGVHAFLGGPGEMELNTSVELTIFRVVQECLSNVQKHANAKHVEIQIERANTELELRVSDDGRGFVPDAVAPGGIEKGVGLVSMRERAELLGGSLSVRSSPGNGCQVVLNIPSMETAVGAHTSPAG